MYFMLAFLLFSLWIEWTSRNCLLSWIQKYLHIYVQATPFSSTQLQGFSTFHQLSVKYCLGVFTITLASPHTFFYFREYPSCEKWRIFIWETCLVPKYLKTYESMKYPFPSYWNNLVRGSRAEKYPNNINAQNKEEKTDTDYI